MSAPRDPTDNEVAELNSTAQPSEAPQAPIDRLAPELFIEIFRAFVYAEIPFSEDVRNAEAQFCHRAPVLLSHVSRKWRHIALSTSALWSCIVYSAPTWNDEPVLTFLSRARSHSLDIYYRHFGNLTSYVIAAHFLKSISAHRLHTKWRDLVFHCAGAKDRLQLWTLLIRTFSKLGVLGLPQLRSLEIILRNKVHYLGPSESMDWNLAQPACSGQSPTLQRLCLSDAALYQVPNMLLYNLRVLELGSHSCVQVLQLCRLLTHIPHLEKLALVDFTPRFDTHLQHEPIPPSAIGLSLTPAVLLEKLKTLVWQSASSSDTHHFLSFLRTPALRVLNISLDDPLPRPLSVSYTNAWRDSEASSTVVELANVTQIKLEFLPARGRCRWRPPLYNLAFASLGELEMIGTCGRASVMPGFDLILSCQSLLALTRLTLRKWHISGCDEMRALSSMPALVSLELHNSSGIDHLLIVLAECIENANGGSMGVKYCPRLETLRFSGCHGLSFKCLSTLLKTRNRGDWKDEISTGPRMLKPLPKRSRYCQQATPMITREKTPKPEKIAYIYVERCELREGLTEEWTAPFFGELGVKEFHMDGVRAITNGGGIEA